MEVDASAGRNGNLAYGCTRLTFKAETVSDRALLWLLFESWRTQDWGYIKRRWIKAFKTLHGVERRRRMKKASLKKN